MAKNKFDDIIKSKLQELENVSIANDWDVFQQLYGDEIKGDEEIFDQNILDTVSGYNVPFNHQHWSLMKEKLEREEFIRTSIYFSKILEAACIFLILFTFLNVFPRLNSGIPAINNVNKIASIVPPISHEIMTTSSAEVQEVSQIQEDLKNNIPDNTTSSSINKKSSLNRNAASITISEKQISVNAFKFIPSLPAVIDKKIASQVKQNKSWVLKGDILIANDKGVTESINQENLPIAVILPSSINLLKSERIFASLDFPLTNARETNSITYLTTSISPTVNIVNSPFDYINKTGAYTVDALGAEIGVSIGMRKNNFAIETGLLYAKKSYEPKEGKEYSGSFFTNYDVNELKKITFDVIAIPLAVKYHFANSDTWNMFFSVGTSFNVIAKSNYRVEENGRVVSDVRNHFRNVARESSLAQKNFENGFFEGGNLLDNLFLSLDLGIGVEKKIGEYSFIQFAPTLRQHIGLAGVGPNNDKVNSLGLNIGFKTKL